jgi:hypothetical protein
VAHLLTRVGQATATTGTGTMTLGAAVSGHRTMATAGALDGCEFTYTIVDGTAWETGIGVYTASGTTLSRSLLASSTGSLLSLTGSAQVFISSLAEDLITGSFDACYDEGSSSPHLKWIPSSTGDVGNSVTLAVNTLYMIPFIQTQRFSFNRIGVRLMTAVAASLFRIGIYTCQTGNGRPGVLVAESGALSGATTGWIEATVTIDLPPGRYYFALLSNGAIAVAAPATSFTIPLLGNRQFDLSKVIGFSRALTYAALPLSEMATTLVSWTTMSATSSILGGYLRKV